MEKGLSVYSRRYVKDCEVCGVRVARGSARFCSNRCQRVLAWTEMKKRIETTGMASSPRSAKRFLKERDGSSCAICKLIVWNAQAIPIVLDHIDGNSDNWSLANLRLVCPNCDAQLPTYKNRNRGNGRHARRLRYASGQSY
ncbi:MAG TPA: HNH endonuclease [Tepidisphaeraceae bacterium]|jgi:endogenous inhibitor of DNA gyrase (YacG/DUF329 family)